MRTLYILPLILLTGCASPKWLENRVACLADKSEAHVLSKWGAFSIGAKIADEDARVICRPDHQK